MAFQLSFSLCVLCVSYVSALQLSEPWSLDGEGTEPLDPVLVSVVVPTCNRGAFLATALHQIAAQDYPHVEVVVVDDGKAPVENVFSALVASEAEDGSGNLIYRYPRSGAQAPNSMDVRLVPLSVPTSIGEKRNHAVRLAAGAIIMHWDDDDLFPPNRISSQVAPLLRGDARMTVLEHKYFFEFSTQSFLEHNEMHRLSNGEVVRYNDFFSKGHGALFLGTLAYKRDVWNEVGGYEQVSKGEDIRFIEAALKNCAPLLNIHGVPNVYVRHNNTAAGAHNTWTFSKLEQHLMYDYAHRVDRPAFVSDEMMAQHLHAEARANEQGRCEAPSGSEAEFMLKYFPEMPYSCCDGKAKPNQGLGCEKLPIEEILANADEDDVQKQQVGGGDEPTLEKTEQRPADMLDEQHVAPESVVDDVANALEQDTEVLNRTALSSGAEPTVDGDAAGEGVLSDSVVNDGAANALEKGTAVANSMAPSSSGMEPGELESTFQSVVAMKDNGKMGEFVRQLLALDNREVIDLEAFKAFLPQFSGMRGTKDFSALVVALLDAPFAVKKKDFSETTYQAIASLKDNGKMGEFARNMLDRDGYEVTNLEAFRAILPGFSGVKETKSFDGFVSALSGASFVAKKQGPQEQ